MSEYYLVTYAEEEDYRPYGVAYSPKDTPSFLLPPCGTPVESWTCIEFELRGGDFADFLANNAAVRLCSTALREIIDDQKSGDDRIQWLDANVHNAENESRPYFILHFPVDFPVVNTARSIMVDDFVVKPVLDKEVIRDHQIFAEPSEIRGRVFVSRELKNRIERAGMTGIGFSRAPVA